MKLGEKIVLQTLPTPFFYTYEKIHEMLFKLFLFMVKIKSGSPKHM